MKEKIFRFNNGFIGTMNEFCLKFGTSKEKNYRNALKWVGRRYNVMTALEQEAYERKRKYARPDYRVYTGTNCFYSITKSLFEKLDLPVSKPEIRHDVFVLPEKNLLFFRYISNEWSGDRYWEDAMAQYAKDACEQTFRLLVGAGWIHTGNFDSEKIIETIISHTDVDVRIQVKGENRSFQFQYSSVLGDRGVDYCRLSYADMTEAGKIIRILNNQQHYYNFNTLVDRMTDCPDTKRADLIYLD